MFTPQRKEKVTDRKPVLVRLEPSVHDAAGKLASEHGLSMSEFVRQCVTHALSGE